jgi:hypothetical protein
MTSGGVLQKYRSCIQSLSAIGLNWRERASSSATENRSKLIDVAGLSFTRQRSFALFRAGMNGHT